MSAFRERYGPWALIGGASEGIGAAFAEALAARGLNLLLVARRPEPLATLATRLAPAPDTNHALAPDAVNALAPGTVNALAPGTVNALAPIEVRTVAADLATPDGLDAVFAAAEDLEVGLVVANAAISPIGPLTTQTREEIERAIDLNCRAPLLLAHHFLPAMRARGRGGFIVMSSLAGQQGSPGIATYAGTKAFDAVLAESLWAELRPYGVDVLACIPGAVSTPGLARNTEARAPGTVTPDVVVSAALRALGRRPRVVPGALMRVSSVIMSRLLTRRAAITTIERASKDVLGRP